MSSQDNTQYIDIQWLKTFGLFRSNVLDYFCTSCFADKSANNFRLRAQGLGHDMLVHHVGLEYAVDEKNISEPRLYVIRMQNRLSPKEVVLLKAYYCLDGVIYQSPLLMDLLYTKLTKASFHLLRAFENLRDLNVRSANVNASADSTETKKFVLALPSFDDVFEDLNKL